MSNTHTQTNIRTTTDFSFQGAKDKGLIVFYEDDAYLKLTEDGSWLAKVDYHDEYTAVIDGSWGSSTDAMVMAMLHRHGVAYNCEAYVDDEPAA